MVISDELNRYIDDQDLLHYYIYWGGHFNPLSDIFSVFASMPKTTKEDILNSGTHRRSFEGLLLKTQIELGKIWDDPNLDINQKIKSADDYLVDRKQDLVTLLGRWNNDKDLS